MGVTGSSATPPVVVAARDLPAELRDSADEVQDALHGLLRAYRSTLTDDRRHLLERFELVDFARKVVGVGSVGTRAWIVLLQGGTARIRSSCRSSRRRRSVLEDHLPKSRFRQPGERVVQGQRMMQAASDIFLGWTKGVQDDIFYFWRQLRDMKGSSDRRAHDPCGHELLRRSSADGRWPGRTPDPVIRWRSPPTSATGTSSTTRWATSRCATPSRTSATTMRSLQRSGRAGSRRWKGSDVNQTKRSPNPEHRRVIERELQAEFSGLLTLATSSA